MPVNLAWLRWTCCGGQASTTGSLAKPQAPERPVFRFQAFKAEPFLESYQPYHCRVTRASSDNQMAHLSLSLFFLTPYLVHSKKNVFPSRAENFCLGNGAFPISPSPPLQNMSLDQIWRNRGKQKKLKKKTKNKKTNLHRPSQ